MPYFWATPRISRCPGRAPPLAGLRGWSRSLGRLPLALVPTADLALGRSLLWHDHELLEQHGPRIDIDVPALRLRPPGRPRFGPGTAAAPRGPRRRRALG